MFKITKAIHVTATERKVIAWMLANDSLTGATKKIHVTMDSLTETVRNLTVRAYDGRVSKIVIEVA